MKKHKCRQLTNIIPSALFLVLSLPACALPKVHRGPSSPRINKGHTPARPAVRPIKARGMDAERATQIQSALISSGYLSGAPTGVWDSDTQKAMQKLQADNGWQTKLTPDSRAIIKLGLGSNTDSASGGSESAGEASNTGSGAHVESHPSSFSHE